MVRPRRSRQVARRASTSRSSRTSTAIICARPTMRGWRTWSRRKTRTRLDERARLLIRAMPVLKPRAQDLNELADGAAFLFAAASACTSTKRRRALLQDDARATARPRAPARLRGWPTGTREAIGAGSARGGRSRRREARQAGAAAARGADRAGRPRREFSMCWCCSGGRKAWRGSPTQHDWRRTD